MTTLVLGVVDLPYSYQGQKKRKKKAATASKTTGDVADILEGKYHVMETFYHLHEKFIGDAILNSYKGSFESLRMGGPSSNPLAGVTELIDQRFRDFVNLKEMDSLGIPGVPTQASLDGVSHRFKSPNKKRAARASFVDTGLYLTSFRSWFE